jgi:hypothetical protein
MNLSEKTLYSLNEVMNSINFELKTGRKIEIEISNPFHEPEDFVRKRKVFINGISVGTIIEEIDPFV